MGWRTTGLLWLLAAPAVAQNIPGHCVGSVDNQGNFHEGDCGGSSSSSSSSSSGGSSYDPEAARRAAEAAAAQARRDAADRAAYKLWQEELLERERLGAQLEPEERAFLDYVHAVGREAHPEAGLLKMFHFTPPPKAPPAERNSAAAQAQCALASTSQALAATVGAPASDVGLVDVRVMAGSWEKNPGCGGSVLKFQRSEAQIEQMKQELPRKVEMVLFARARAAKAKAAAAEKAAEVKRLEEQLPPLPPPTEKVEAKPPEATPPPEKPEEKKESKKSDLLERIKRAKAEAERNGDQAAQKLAEVGAALEKASDEQSKLEREANESAEQAAAVMRSIEVDAKVVKGTPAP